MIYAYAIVDWPGPLVSRIDGLEDAPVYVIGYREIGAIVSPISTGEVLTTEANLWRHEAVMDAFMSERTLLPVRFGTTLADEKSVESILAARYEGFVARLDRVRGHVELALRVCWDSPDVDALAQDPGPTSAASRELTSSRRGYMTARLQEYRDRQRHRERAREYAEILHSALTGMATQSAHRLLPAPRVLMTSAYLVKSEEVADFQRELEKLRASHPDLRLFCTGPWPPFTFAAQEECDNGYDNPDAFAVGPVRFG